MSKIEKTLELNITHEILQLADSFWWFLQSNALRRHWHPHHRFPLIAPPKSFASGLHINLEGKKGGGYDVCINSPSNFGGGNPRLLFMQFKAGVEKPFNTNTDSKFFGNSANPEIHIEFDINSNTKKDQHRLLQTLASNVGNKNAVVYVFPRMVNIGQLQDNLGKLLSKTSFISIDEIDKKASDNNVTIDDGNAHKFRTCYNDYDKNEVNFFFFFFGRQKKPGGVLGEIFAVRIYRALNLLRENQNSAFPFVKRQITDALIRYLLNIGMSFSIPFESIISFFNEFPYFKQHIERYFQSNPFQKYVVDQPASEWVEDIFSDILTEIAIYFAWVEVNNTSEIYNSEIPNPPANFTVELKKEGFRFGLDTEEDQIEEDLENILYTLF